MLSVCSRFQIFGDGTDKMILVADGQGFVIRNPLLYQMETTCHNICFDTMGDRHVVPGRITTDLHFTAGEVETISAADLPAIYDPLMQKSVLELMQAVNKKLRDRV